VQSPTDALKSKAEYFLQLGQADEAAAVYEELILADPASGNVINPLLVDLYIKANEPEKALEKAKAHMITTPDPPAYLAQVYSRMNMFTEAEAILRQEISGEEKTSRLVVLYFQLTGIQSDAGQKDQAAETAKKAVEISAGTPYESATRRLLAEIIGRQSHPE
jgi:tetratricopeptide (TPR) repeat protein